MEWSRAIQYLVIINMAGFLLAAADAWMRRKTGRQMGAVLMGISLPGGALGVLAGLILLNRRLDKSNMMSRVFVACMAVLQGALLVFLKNGSGGEFTFAFWRFFAAHRRLTACLVLVNLVTFAAFGIDKWKAVRNRPRIRIVTLLGLSFFGGAAGGLAGMYLFHHKTRRDYFAVGLPLMLAAQAAVLFCVMNL